jgi:hypothetical protein
MSSDDLARAVYEAVKAVVRKYETMPTVLPQQKRYRKVAAEIARECEAAAADVLADAKGGVGR